MSTTSLGQVWVDSAWARLTGHYGRAVNQQTDPKRIPRTFEHGRVVTVGTGDWTSGFFAGTLWLIHQRTGQADWAHQARKWTQPILKEATNPTTHDLGFMLNCSAGQGYRLKGDTAYRRALLTAARTLSGRFTPKYQVMRSWDWKPQSMCWVHPVIIDNMMNLELLYWAAGQGGGPRLAEQATAHARTTAREHFRPNGSTYHVVDFDSTSRNGIRWRGTWQGYANASAWSRGHAWALYGYAFCYEKTRDTLFLNRANRVLDFMINHRHMPADLVPYWDFNAPEIPNEPRDASSAAIIASGLLILDKVTAPAPPQATQRDARRGRGRGAPQVATPQIPSGPPSRYRALAGRMLESLASDAYLAPVGTNGNFALKHSTGAAPYNGEVDVPLNYADYYFAEALLRWQGQL